MSKFHYNTTSKSLHNFVHYTKATEQAAILENASSKFMKALATTKDKDGEIFFAKILKQHLPDFPKLLEKHAEAFESFFCAGGSIPQNFHPMAIPNPAEMLHTTFHEGRIGTVIAFLNNERFTHTHKQEIGTPFSYQGSYPVPLSHIMHSSYGNEKIEREKKVFFAAFKARGGDYFRDFSPTNKILYYCDLTYKNYLRAQTELKASQAKPELVVEQSAPAAALSSEQELKIADDSNMFADADNS